MLSYYDGELTNTQFLVSQVGDDGLKNEDVVLRIYEAGCARVDGYFVLLLYNSSIVNVPRKKHPASELRTLEYSFCTPFTAPPEFHGCHSQSNQLPTLLPGYGDDMHK